MSSCRRPSLGQCPERIAAAKETEAAKIRAGLIDPKELTYKEHADKPLADHLADWHSDLLAKGKTANYADLSRDRAGKLVAMVNGASLDDLVPGRKAEAMERAARLLADELARARFADLTAEKIQAALARLRDKGRSAQTANHFRAAIRSFLKWCHKRGRIREVPSDGVEGFNVEEDLRHIRRSLTAAEFARLIAHAEHARPVLGMPGPLRAMAYRVAASGFRVDELRSLTPESFRLDGDEPSISLEAGDAKNRKAVGQPIPRRTRQPPPRLAEGQAGWRIRLPAPPRHREGDQARLGGVRHPIRDGRRGRRLPFPAGLLRLGIGPRRRVDLRGATAGPARQARDHAQTLRQGGQERHAWRRGGDAGATGEGAVRTHGCNRNGSGPCRFVCRLPVSIRRAQTPLVVRWCARPEIRAHGLAGDGKPLISGVLACVRVRSGEGGIRTPETGFPV